MDYLSRAKDPADGYDTSDTIGDAVDAALAAGCGHCHRPFDLDVNADPDGGPADFVVFVAPPLSAATLSRPTTYVTVAHGSCGPAIGDAIATAFADRDQDR